MSLLRALVVSVILTTVACGGGGGGSGTPYDGTPTQPSPPPAPNPNASVVIIPDNAEFLGNNAFGGPLNVTVGATVTWTNEDAIAHNIQADSGAFGSGVLGPNRNYSFTFQSAGNMPYHCNIHPTMRGVVTVQ